MRKPGWRMIEKRTLKIAIASGKGGTGKTLVATNLAHQMSQHIQTLLVDLDVEEPNDFLFIKGDPLSTSPRYKMVPEWHKDSCQQCGICSSVCSFNAILQLGPIVTVFPELCHSCHACSELCPTSSLPMNPVKIGDITIVRSGNLTAVESRLQVGEEQAVPLIRQTYEYLDQASLGQLPLLLFDCPPGTSCPVVAAVKGVDWVLLVTEPTPFGLNDLKLAVETMKQLYKPVAVVINRYGIGNQDVENFCEENSIPVIARIPFDRRIAAAYASGKLMDPEIDSFKEPLNKISEFILDTI
jgi:MinD superfamily P-loop ATPase